MKDATIEVLTITLRTAYNGIVEAKKLCSEKIVHHELNPILKDIDEVLMAVEEEMGKNSDSLGGETNCHY
ncbi:hypothetical protein [Virgibacillus pantothenticus]|uniref:hypothetical protein n=1 Tax=Virgibacillus pantothenticus TaxID=1473 RepID=UPI00098504E9|nr:hypothetical protein [Virgibacillus pantothenticus]